MSSSPTTPALALVASASSDGRTDIETEYGHQPLLSAIEDTECRRILSLTADGAMSARELAEALDIPLSTTYRKLDAMTDGGLLEERTRIHQAGKHANEYSPLIDDVVITIDQGVGVQIEVSRRDAEERAFWPNQRGGE